MRDVKSFNALPFGWMELDDAGTVTQYSPAAEGKEMNDSTLDLVGCNLFTDVAPIAEVKEFRDRFQVFVQSPLPTEVFNLKFKDSHESVHARIMLAQISQQQHSSNGKLVLVSVTKA
ncbi:MAG TPA: hypothetical protein VF658_08335 [Pyrinomonadaceae bacterium]